MQQSSGRRRMVGLLASCGRGYEGACQLGLCSAAGQRAQCLNQGKGFYFCGVNNLAVGDAERPGLWWLHGIVETQARCSVIG